MKQRHFKALTSLLLVVMMLASMLPAIPVTVNAASTNTYEKVELADIKATDKVIIVSSKGSSHFALYSGNGTGSAPTAVSVTIDGDEIEAADGAKIFWNISNDNGTLTIYVDESTTSWLYCTSTNNGVRVGTNASKTFTMDTSGYLKHTGTSRYLGVYNSQDWRCYTNTTGNTAGQTFSFYKLKEASSCPHTNTTAIGEAKEATCTEPGITAGIKCLDCQEIVEKQKEIPMIAHDYVNGFCSVCNAELPKTLTITKASFPEVSNSYAWYDWSENTASGDTITGKGFLYQNTAIQMNGSKAGNFIYNDVALPGAIVSVTLTTASGTNRNYDVLTSDTPFNSSTGKLTGTSAKKEVTTTGTTWEFDTTHRYFAIVLTDSNPGYLASIEITYAAPCTNHTGGTPTCTEPAKCENCGAEYGEPAGHTEVEIPAVAPSCTEDGLTAGVKCSVCDETLTAQQIDPATGHTDTNPKDGKCDTCGTNFCTEHVWVDGEVLVEGDCTTDRVVSQVCDNCGEPGEDRVETAPGHTEEAIPAVAPSCTEDGSTAGVKCSVCDEILTAPETAPATGHNYENGVCTECGAEKPKGLDGRYYIATIRTSGNYWYMTNDLGTASTQRYQAADSGLSELPSFISTSEADSSKIFVLELAEDGKYYIYAEGIDGDAKYLGWSSGNSGILVAKASAKQFTVKEKDGLFNIYFNDRYLSLNGTSGNNYFAFYTGTQKQDLALIPVVTPEIESPKLQNYNVSLTEGVKISFNYNVSPDWLVANPGAYVKFNNVETALEEAGVYTFTVTLTPKKINEALSLVLCDANGNEINTYDVSFSKYYEKAYAQGEINALNTLLDAIVTYGKAATGEAGSITEEFTNDGAYTKEDNDKVFGQISASLAESATIKLQINEANIQDTYKIKVTHKGDTIANGNLTSYISDGYLVIHRIYAADFNEEFEIEILDGETRVAYAKLTFNQYLKALYNSGLTEVTDDVKTLIAAIYQYGVAVENYITPSAQ